MQNFLIDIRRTKLSVRTFPQPATLPLQIVPFFLTPQGSERRIPATFSGNSGRGPSPEKSHAIQRESTACSICRVGPFSASTRSARPADNGCGPPTPEGTSAAIATRLFVTFRPRSAPACGCAPVRWAAIVPRAARREGQGKVARPREGRCGQAIAQGPARPGANRDEPSPQFQPIFAVFRPFSVSSRTLW